MRATHLKAGLVVALVLAASGAQAATEVSCGDVLSTPGHYYLAEDLVCPSTPAVLITASDVHFNLRRHSITRSGGNGSGIHVNGDGLGCPPDLPELSNIHINNGVVDGFDFGIQACSTTDLRIDKVSAINSITALALHQVSDSDIKASTFTASDTAVQVRDSHSNRFEANRLDGLEGNGCNRGFFLSESTNNFVTGNKISGCDGDSGVALFAANSNIVRGNKVTTAAGANYGIVATASTDGNIIQSNRVTGPVDDAHLRDLSDTCDNNLWKSNHFTTADPSCID